MATERVASTCITFLDYDFERQNLRLTYSNGRSYVYHGVPNYVYIGLMQAPSKGKYVNAVVKSYPYSRVG
jgi:hypothetical protein